MDIENRSITFWLLYIISTYQNLQIGAFPLKKNNHSIEEPESAYINVLAQSKTSSAFLQKFWPFISFLFSPPQVSCGIVKLILPAIVEFEILVSAWRNNLLRLNQTAVAVISCDGKGECKVRERRAQGEASTSVRRGKGKGEEGKGEARARRG